MNTYLIGALLAPIAIVGATEEDCEQAAEALALILKNNNLVLDILVEHPFAKKEEIDQAFRQKEAVFQDYLHKIEEAHLQYRQKQQKLPHETMGKYRNTYLQQKALFMSYVELLDITDEDLEKLYIPFAEIKFHDQGAVHEDTRRQTLDLWEKCKEDMYEVLALLAGINSAKSAEKALSRIKRVAESFEGKMEVYKLYLDDDPQGAAATQETVKKEHPRIRDAIKAEATRILSDGCFGCEELAVFLRRLWL